MISSDLTDVTKPATLPPLGDDVVVVSGLPRSGTSLLMQMLDAGGMQILTDNKREADEDNPRGYFEFEPVKKMLGNDANTGWIAGARGKAVKVVVPIVASLPIGQRYRVILVERDLGELLASQARMIARLGSVIPDSSERRDHLAREYARIMERTVAILEARADVRLLIVRYGSILADPLLAAAAINAFVGGALDTARMAAVVEPALHRNRDRDVLSD